MAGRGEAVIDDATLDGYGVMRKRGASDEAIARAMIRDERAALAAAEMSVEPGDRAIVETVVAYGAKELGIAAPRARFFRGAGKTFGGVVYRDWPGEVWLAGDRPWFAMGELALHELAHVAHFRDGLPHDARERDAERFAARGRHLVRSAARAVAQRER